MKGYLSGVVLLLLSSTTTATQLEIKSLEYRYPNSTEIQYRVPRFPQRIIQRLQNALTIIFSQASLISYRVIIRRRQ